MKPTSLVLTLLLAFAAVGTIQAQNWTTITSGWRPRSVIATSGHVWAPSEGGLLSVTTLSRELQVLNVDDGLSSNFLTVAELDESSGLLWLGHDNGLLDVFDPESREVVQVIRDFYNDPAVQTIHDIYAGESGIFVATNQGLSLMRQVENETLWVVQETYRGFGSWPRPTGITHVEMAGSTLFAGSLRGVARADAGMNLLDATNWTIHPVSEFIPGQDELSIRMMTTSQGAVNLGFGGTRLYRWNGSQWEERNTLYGAYDIAETPSGVVYLAMGDGLFRKLPEESDYVRLEDDYTPKFWGVTVGPDGMIWGAVDTSPSWFGGIARWDGASMDVVFPNSPGGDQILNSGVSPEGDVWFAARSSRIAGVYANQDGIWRPWARPNAPQAPWNRTTAINLIEFDGYGGTWIGTWGNSTYYIKTMSDDSDSLFYFNSSNSLLQGVDEGGNYIVVNGAEPDPRGGFWISTMLAWNNATLTYIPPMWFFSDPANWDMNSWVQFGPEQGNTFAKLSQIELDSQGRLWMTSLHQDPDEPIVVYDPGNDLSDPYEDTDQWYHEFDFAGDVEFETVNALAMGDDDILWLGTREGLFYADASLPVGQVVFTEVFGALGQSINAIAIDPLNQIWVGTDFGVSVLGRDRFTWIAQYTTSDGPHPSGLVDDQVTSISVQPQTGDVFIGTNAGVSVLSTPYREFGETVEEIVVAPQPFVIGQGQENLRFGSSSLVADADVRLFSPSGRLVRTLSFQQASGSGWDGRDEDGDWVGSGVYYIVVTEPDGASHTGKVAVVRK